MAGPVSRALPLQSLLDRFIDPYEPMTAPDDAERRLLEAVRRDVEWMLNSRRTPVEPPAHFAELRRSAFIWGLPDLTSLAVKSKSDRVRLQRVLQETVSAMEPRLRDVRVTLTETNDAVQSIRFTIAATLVAPPCVDRVAFNTVVDLGSGKCRVEGDR
jgi:type VI secretion system protein ImpF